MQQNRQTVFIADLHLTKKKPQIVAVFFRFLDDLKSKNIDALYILGDLFEYWIGDDDLSEFNIRIAEKLASCADYFPIYFCHGNRDFLLGEDFASLAKIKLLAEITKINLYGKQALIMHGDILCIDDLEYQKFRLKVQDSNWQKKVMSYPLWLRKIIALKIRFQSMIANQSKYKNNKEIMDVNNECVVEYLLKYDVNLLIHGHTHRPAEHEILLDEKLNKTARRLVVSDWVENQQQIKVVVADFSSIYLRFLDIF